MAIQELSSTYVPLDCFAIARLERRASFDALWLAMTTLVRPNRARRRLVWEWTPLIFLILLAGLQSLPQEPFEAAQVDGAGPWRTFVDLTLPMMRPVLAVAIVLRTIDAFGTFDQVFVLTRGGPGTSTKLISLYGYEVAFKFQQTGYAAALFVTVGLLILALALAAVRLLRRAEAT